MLDKDELKIALEKNHVEMCVFGTLKYIRFRSSYKKIERGSIITEPPRICGSLGVTPKKSAPPFEEKRLQPKAILSGATSSFNFTGGIENDVVFRISPWKFTKSNFFPGFPHIKRIFTLEKGLEKNITDDSIFAEEKIDGYNLRTILIDNEIYGLSRGGIIDSFSSEKLRELIPKKVLGNKLMLCGEMTGNTPYTKPTKNYDVKYYVFDVYDLEKKEYLSSEARYSFLKKNDLESTPYLGKFNIKKDMKKLKELVLNMNKRGGEGIVFKSVDRSQIVKYVNPNADIEDFANTIKMLFDMPIGYFNQRLLRSAIFVKEYGLDVESYGKKLGKCMYEKFAEGLKMLEHDNAIYDEFEIVIKDSTIWNELKSHMSKEVKLELVFKREENEKTRIRFKKIYTKSTKKIREFINGRGITD